MLLFAAALTPRLVGLRSFLPHASDPDPYLVVQLGVLEENGVADRSVAGWKYPHLIPALATLVPGAEVGAGAPAGATLEEHRRAAAAPHLRVRTVVSVLSALAAPATFLLALRLLRLRWALAAGVVAGFTLLGVSLAGQARPHAAVGGVLAVSLLASVRFRERASTARALAAGLCAGAAASTLQFGVSALAPLIAAWCIARARRDALATGARGCLRGALAVGVCMGIAAWFNLREADGYGRALERSNAAGEAFWLGGHRLPSSRFDGGGWSGAARAFLGCDPGATLLAALGLVSALAALARRRVPAAAVVVAAAALPTLLVLGSYTQSYPRFFACLTAPLALLAGCGASTVARRLPSGTALACAALLAAAAPAVEWTRLRSQPDTYERVAEHVIWNQGADTSVHAINVRGLPLASRSLSAERSWAGVAWDKYQLAHGAPIPGALDLTYAPYAQTRAMLETNDPAVARAYVAALQADTVVLGLDARDFRPAAAEEQCARLLHVRAALEDEGWTRTFSAVGQTEAGLRAAGYFVDVPIVLGAARAGPNLEVWRR